MGIDGDDTLWHNENIFRGVQNRFGELMESYGYDRSSSTAALDRIEGGHLGLYGYGVKGFGLCLIETAVELTDGAVSSHELAEMTRWIRGMLEHPVELLDGVAEALDALGEDHRLLLITKGDLHDQGRKVKASGLAHHFEAVHIVAEKDEATYREILEANALNSADFVMIGNSVRSDILPVVALGAAAVHIEYHLTWAHEQVQSATPTETGYHQAENLAAVVPYLQALSTSR